jgi:hypothetical protein
LSRHDGGLTCDAVPNAFSHTLGRSAEGETTVSCTRSSTTRRHGATGSHRTERAAPLW